MRTATFVSTARCGVVLGDGLGDKAMAALRVSRKAGTSISAFVAQLSAHDDEYLEQVYESQKYFDEDESEDGATPFEPSPPNAFASIDFHLGGFKVTNRP